MFNPHSPEGHSAWDYANSIIAWLQKIVETLEKGQGRSPVVRRLPWSIATDANGNGVANVAVHRGASLELIGIAFQGSNTGYIATYFNEAGDGGNLIKVNQSASLVSDTFDSEEVTSDMVRIVISAVGQTANSTVTGNIRFRQFESNPSEPKGA